MLQRGRPVTHKFDVESFFFRWYSDWYEHGEIRPANIAMPDQSVNRSGFGGRFWHVLLPDPTTLPEIAVVRLCMGVIKLTGDVLPMKTEQFTRMIEFRIVHAPEEHNYQHCEIAVCCNGLRLRKSEADALPVGELRTCWKAANKWFRIEMSKAIRQGRVVEVLRPEIATKSRR